MRTAVKVSFIVALSLIVAGGLLFTVGMTMLNWDFMNISNDKYQLHAYDITEDFQNLKVVTKTADVIVVPSEDGKISVTCYEEEKMQHTVSVKDGTLCIELNDTRKWFDHIRIFSIASGKITISMPVGEYGTLSINSSTSDKTLSDGFTFSRIDVACSTGDTICRASAAEHIKIRQTTGHIRMENIHAGSLELSVSTGKINLSSITCSGAATLSADTGDIHIGNTTCDFLHVKGNTGDVRLTQVFAETSFDIETDTGDVKFDQCDAATLKVKTDTGDVTGTLTSDKIFMVSSDTGKIDVPKSLSGGACEITVDTGDVRIQIQPR